MPIGDTDFICCSNEKAIYGESLIFPLYVEYEFHKNMKRWKWRGWKYLVNIGDCEEIDLLAVHKYNMIMIITNRLPMHKRQETELLCSSIQVYAVYIIHLFNLNFSKQWKMKIEKCWEIFNNIFMSVQSTLFIICLFITYWLFLINFYLLIYFFLINFDCRWTKDGIIAFQHSGLAAFHILLDNLSSFKIILIRAHRVFVLRRC